MRLAITAAATIACLLSAASAENSGGYRGPDRNGIYPAEGLLKTWPDEGPDLLWKATGIGAGWSSITVHAGRVYLLGGIDPGYLYCYTLDGKRIYREAYGKDRAEGRFAGARSTVEIHDNKAYFVTGDGVVHCRDAATGKGVWKVDTVKQFGNKVPGHGYNITPLIHDGKFICPIRRGKHTHVALDLDTGKVVWANKPSTYAIGDSSPILVETQGGQLVVDNLWHALVGLKPKTGKIVWTFRQGRTGTMMTPVFNHGHVFADLGKHRAGLFKPAEDGNSLELLWRTEHGVSDITQSLIFDGKVFALAGGRETRQVTEEKNGKAQTRTVTRKYRALKAYSMKDGAVLQEHKFAHDGSMVAADGHIYLLTGGEDNWTGPKGPDTWIWLIRPTDKGFKVVSKFKPAGGRKEAWINPVIATGRLFYRQGSVLSVYDLRPESYKEE
jgi:outer membrane protein assembly factor BamB